MALTGYDKAAVSGAQSPRLVYVKVKADDGTWCNITRHVTAARGDPWVNTLMKAPNVTHRTELGSGAFAAASTSIELYDPDNSWSADGLTLVDDSGDDHALAYWFGAWVKIGFQHHVDSPTSWAEEDLAVFTIADVQRSRTGRTVKVTLHGLEKILMDVKSTDLKRGGGPFINIPLPNLVTELLEFGGSGDISFTSGSPPGSCDIATDGDVMSLLGNIPMLDSAGDWVEAQNFVARYQLAIGDVLYFVGYVKQNNKPAIVKWDRGTNAWSEVVEFGTAGWEAIYAWPASGANLSYIWVFCITNKTASGFENDLYTIPMQPYKVVRSSLSASAHGVELKMWPTTILAHKPYIYDNEGSAGIDFYGRMDVGPGGDHGTYNPAAFFRSANSIPGYAGHTISAAANAETGRLEPDRLEAADTVSTYFSAKTDWTGGTLDPGYYVSERDTLASLDFHPPMFTFMHNNPSEGFKKNSHFNRLNWAWYDKAAEVWKLSHITQELGAVVDQAIAFPFGSGDDDFYQKQITAFDVVAHDNLVTSLVIATIDMSDAQPSGQDIDAIVSRVRPMPQSGTITVTAGTRMDFGNDQMDFSASANYCPIVIGIRGSTTAGDNRAWGQVCNWFAANSAGAYGLFWWTTSAATDSGVFKNTPGANTFLPCSSAPFIISNIDENSSNRACYLFDQATGNVWYGDPTNHGTITPVSLGEPVDGENTWASSNLLIEETGTYAGRLYGVSASAPPADVRIPVRAYGASTPGLGAASPGGRLSFWDYSPNLPDNIRIADFGDASVWAALDMARFRAGDYIMGIDGSGNFYFTPRPSGTPALTIKCRDSGAIKTDGTEIPCDSLVSKHKHSGVANCITLPAFRGERGNAQVDVVLVSRDNDDLQWTKDMIVDAHPMNTVAQRVVLTCINTSTLGSTTYDPLLFSWRKVLADLTTTLAQAASTSTTTIYVRGLYEAQDGTNRLGDAAVSVGDTLQVGDGDWAVIISIDASAGTMTVTGGVGGTDTHKVGSTVRIRPQDKHAHSDSSDGICKVTQTYNIPAGSTVSTLTVDDTSQVAVGTVLFADSAMVQVLEVTSATTLAVKPNILSSGRGRSAQFESSLVLNGAIWIEETNKAYQVADTGVAVSISSSNKDIFRSGRFEVGDRIVIDAPGFVVKQVKHSTVRITNSASIARYGKKDYKPKAPNRLVNEATGRTLLQSLDHLPFPFWETTAKACPICPSIAPGDMIYCRDEWLWPNETDNQVAHHVVGWTVNLDAGTMDIYLRSEGSQTAIEAPEVEVLTGSEWEVHDVHDNQ